MFFVFASTVSMSSGRNGKNDVRLIERFLKLVEWRQLYVHVVHSHVRVISLVLARPRCSLSGFPGRPAKLTTSSSLSPLSPRSH